MPVPIVYRRGSEAIISYPYQDIIEGTGLVVFYLATAWTSALQYILTTNSSLKSHLQYLDTSPGNSSSLLYDNTFTVTNNIQRIINGNIVGCFQTEITAGSANSKPVSVRMTMSINSEEILDVTGETFTQNGLKTHTLTGSVTEKPLKVGDVISVRVRITAGGSPMGTATLRYGHDPAGRAMPGTTPADSKIFIPFRINT